MYCSTTFLSILFYEWLNLLPTWVCSDFISEENCPSGNWSKSPISNSPHYVPSLTPDPLVLLSKLNICCNDASRRVSHQCGQFFIMKSNVPFERRLILTDYEQEGDKKFTTLGKLRKITKNIGCNRKFQMGKFFSWIALLIC